MFFIIAVFINCNFAYTDSVQDENKMLNGGKDAGYDQGYALGLRDKQNGEAYSYNGAVDESSEHILFIVWEIVGEYGEKMAGLFKNGYDDGFRQGYQDGYNRKSKKETMYDGTIADKKY